MIILDLLLILWTAKLVQNDKWYCFCNDFILGITASSFVAVFTEMAHNYRHNKIGERELWNYYSFLLEYYVAMAGMKQNKKYLREMRRYIKVPVKRKNKKDKAKIIWLQLPRIKLEMENALLKRDYLNKEEIISIDAILGHIKIILSIIQDFKIKIPGNEVLCKKYTPLLDRWLDPEIKKSLPKKYIESLSQIEVKLSLDKAMESIIQSNATLQNASDGIRIGKKWIMKDNCFNKAINDPTKETELCSSLINDNLMHIYELLEELRKEAYKSPILGVLLTEYD